MSVDYDQLLSKLKETLTNSQPGKAYLDAAMKFLKDNRDVYHWVGIYFLEGDLLKVGPYYGPKTDHVEIPVGRGVCGTAVAENKNQVITDVRELDNYLACNLGIEGNNLSSDEQAINKCLEKFGNHPFDENQVRNFRKIAAAAVNRSFMEQALP